MLSDISGMADWAKVCTGLVRMFEGKSRRRERGEENKREEGRGE